MLLNYVWNDHKQNAFWTLKCDCSWIICQLRKKTHVACRWVCMPRHQWMDFHLGTWVIQVQKVKKNLIILHKYVVFIKWCEKDYKINKILTRNSILYFDWTSKYSIWSSPFYLKARKIIIMHILQVKNIFEV